MHLFRKLLCLIPVLFVIAMSAPAQADSGGSIIWLLPDDTVHESDVTLQAKAAAITYSTPSYTPFKVRVQVWDLTGTEPLCIQDQNHFFSVQGTTVQIVGTNPIIYLPFLDDGLYAVTGEVYHMVNGSYVKLDDAYAEFEKVSP